tara:strand:+ start:6557 stop:7486 length:930 start_codon:yes stop_codon:yes gene_type:complete
MACVYSGKVRDIYKYDELENCIVLRATGRQSAFDRQIAIVPFKGVVLNQTSLWWFQKTKHIIDNHAIMSPSPDVLVAKKCVPFPIEFVVRGYITGSTSTSMWSHYKDGCREYCGIKLPDGLVKNQKLQTPICTPTTKDVHDIPISPKDIVESGRMTQDEWDFCSKKALELFEFGQKKAYERGLILVDTKYEFGRDVNNNVILIDEIHTPDSSRYWIEDTYQFKFNNHQEPDSIDKEFLRLWIRERCNPYTVEKLPEIPTELIVELAERYIDLYKIITGNEFYFNETDSTLLCESNDIVKKMTQDYRKYC